MSSSSSRFWLSEKLAETVINQEGENELEEEEETA